MTITLTDYIQTELNCTRHEARKLEEVVLSFQALGFAGLELIEQLRITIHLDTFGADLAQNTIIKMIDEPQQKKSAFPQPKRRQPHPRQYKNMRDKRRHRR